MIHTSKHKRKTSKAPGPVKANYIVTVEQKILSPSHVLILQVYLQADKRLTANLSNISGINSWRMSCQMGFFFQGKDKRQSISFDPTIFCAKTNTSQGII